MTQLAANSTGIIHPATNEAFLLRQILMLLQKVFPHAEVNSWGYMTFLFTGIWAVIFSILYLQSNRFLALGMVLICCILLSENIIKVNSSRTSLILGFGAILLLFVFQKSNQRKFLVLFYSLAILSVLNRLELGAITFFIAVIVIFLTTRNRNLVSHCLVPFGFSLFCLIFFVSYNATYHSFVNKFLSIERKIIHHENFIYNRFEMMAIIRGEENDRQKLIDMGNAFFLLDEPILDYNRTTDLLKYRTFVEYLYRDRTLFFKKYLQNAAWLLQFYRESIFLAISLLVMLMLWLYRLYKSKQLKLGILISIILVAILPFFLSVNVGLSERFMGPFTALSFLTILMVAFNGNLLEIKTKAVLLIFSICMTLIHFNVYIKRELPPLKERQIISQAVLQDYNDEFTEGNNPVFLSPMSSMVLPGKLFNPISDHYDRYRFINMSFVDYTGFFRKRKLSIYGPDYAKLTTRMKYLEQNSRYLYANSYAMSFIDSYLKNVHEMEFCYRIVDDFDSLQSGRLIKVFKYEILDVASTSCD